MVRIEISKAAHLIGHRNPVYAMETGIGNRSFYTAGNDKGIVEWDLETMSVKRILCPVAHTVYGLYRLPGEERMLAAMRNGTVLLLDTGAGTTGGTGTNTSRIVAQIRHHTKPVFAIGSFPCPDDTDAHKTTRRIVIGSEDGTASVWSLEGLQAGSATLSEPVLQQHLTVSDAPIRCLDTSPDGRTIAFGTKDGMVRIYATRDYSLQQVLAAHQMPVTSLRFSPDGRYLLSTGRDAELHVYRTDDYQLERTIVPHLFAVYTIQYHPYLPVFATCSRDKAIKIWSSEDFRLLRVISRDKGLDAHHLSVNTLTWDVSGRYLLSAGDDKAVMVWNVKESTNDGIN